MMPLFHSAPCLNDGVGIRSGSEAILERLKVNESHDPVATVAVLAPGYTRILRPRFCVMIPEANSSGQMTRPIQILRKLSFVFFLVALACATIAAQSTTSEGQSSQKQSSITTSVPSVTENKQGVAQPAYLTPISGYQGVLA